MTCEICEALSREKNSETSMSKIIEAFYNYTNNIFRNYHDRESTSIILGLKH